MDVLKKLEHDAVEIGDHMWETISGTKPPENH